MSNTSTNGAALVLSNLAKTYGPLTVVRDVSLSVAPGEFVTFLGPSGSGKTTTLNLIAGFTLASSGHITLDGRDLGNVPAHQRGIGVVFQSYALFPHMTVRQNIAYPLEQRRPRIGRAAIEARVRRVLELVEMAGYADRRPDQLSGGQQQRVALARALVFEPRLVLMDEPLGALDKNLREAMQYEIKRLHTRLGVTIVYVTHDQSEALTMSDRVAVFHQGKIQQIARPKDLYEDPSNAFVANFIGENNSLQGQVSACDGTYATLALGPDVSVRGRAGEGISTGSNAVLALRPENVSFNAAAGDNDNRMTGAIDEVIYCGDHWRLHLTIAGHDGFIIKLPNKTAATPPIPRTVATISWGQDDCKIVALESA